jgi:hypothetical protein
LRYGCETNIFESSGIARDDCEKLNTGKKGQTCGVVVGLAVEITKQTLGIETRKKLLYLDQSFFSAASKERRHDWVDDAIARITELLDLQLLAIPYSSSHIAEADLYKQRDALVTFIQRLSRAHHFEPYYRLEETQILKAFQAFLADKPAQYVKEERDVISTSVHDWDGQYSVSVFTAESGFDRKRAFKQRSVDALLDALDDWSNSSKTFEQDMELEFHDAAQIFVHEYAKQTARLYCWDFAALIDSPIVAGVGEGLFFVVRTLKADPRSIGAFFASQHFREIPSQQLSARLYSTFKERLRKKAIRLPASREEREQKYSGLMFDVEHASTYAPYCDAFFTDKAMADLMNDDRVAVENLYGCKVFSAASREEFFKWLSDLRANMTPEHADGLSWAYARYRKP